MRQRSLVSEKEEQIRGVLNGGDKNKLHSPSALTIYISLILTFLSPFSPIPTIQFLNYPNAQSWVTKARHPTLQPGTLCKKRIKRPSPRREILIYKNYAPSLRNHELPFPFPFQNHAMPISISLSLSSVHHYYPARGISILDSPNSLSDEIYAPEPAVHSPHQTDPQDMCWAHVLLRHTPGSDSAYWNSACPLFQYHRLDYQAAWVVGIRVFEEGWTY
jgi:hypothetical protein